MPQEKMTMDQVRERFPEYDDMDDMTLANAIHGRFYSDIPLADFYASVGFNPQQDTGDNGIYPDTGPGSSPNNPIDLATVDRATAAGMTRGMWVKGPDGTVYALPSDPVEGQFRVGDLPQAPGVNVRPQSIVEDIAKSLPTGVVEGLTGLAGMQGTIGQMIYGEQSLGQNMPGFGIVGPTGEQLNETIRQGLGRDYYQPQTVAGEYSRTLGEFLPGALAPGSALARGASVAVPAFASESAGQIARGMSGGERDTTAEGLARLGGGLLGGFGVGGLSAVRGGADISLRNAAEGVTPQNLQLATALRRDAEAMGIDLTNAEAIQQVTGGGSGLGRLQRVVEGQTTRMAPMFANRPAQVQGAIEARLNQIAPSVEPSTLAPRVRDAAEGVLTRLRQRANEDAGPFYRRLPGQSLPPEQFQQLTETPSFMNALRAVRGDEEIAPLLSRELPMDEPTRMLRARQQGFTTEGYRGASGEDQLFSTSREAARRGTFFSSDPEIASTYAPSQGGVVFPVLARENASVVADAGGRNWNRLTGDTPVRTPEIMASRTEENDILEGLGLARGPETRVRPAEETTFDRLLGGTLSDYRSNNDLADWARRQGFGGLRTNNMVDSADNATFGGASDVSTIFNPADLRSRFDAFPAPTPDNDLNVINEVVKQLRTMAEEAAPNSARVGGSMTRASVRGQAADLADALARQASPDYAMARDTVRGVNEAFIDPLRAGQIGALADAGPAPKLENMTGLMFPNTPFEGQAAETARALELMGEIDPSVGGPLVRQQLARQAMEAQQDLATGSNQFGGANFAARAFGNPEQRRTVMGALDVVNRPDPNMAFPALSANAMPARGSDPMAQLVEVLQATGQRHRAGSDTAFNQDIQRQIAGGNVATGAVRSVANIPGIPGRIATGIDDIVARRNAETLADLLMANSEDFNARLTRALNRPRGANRIRAGVAVTAGQED
jgi:hypothetical protein